MFDFPRVALEGDVKFTFYRGKKVSVSTHTHTQAYTRKHIHTYAYTHNFISIHTLTNL